MGKNARTRALRNEVLLTPDVLKHWAVDQTAWHETQEEIEAKLAWGREKARLLAWVGEQMEIRLTAIERRYLRLYFFEGRTYREVAGITGTNASSVHRGVARGIRKLQIAAKEQGISPRKL